LVYIGKGSKQLIGFIVTPLLTINLPDTVSSSIVVQNSFCGAAQVPVLYEKYEDQIDSYGEKGWVEIKKQYAVFDEKVLSKVPRGPAKDKKH
jgi:hypothetical protein